MTLVSQEIKNLVAGISQQPAILRHAEQVEEQVNALSTEAAGLQKRPPTIHIADLGLTKGTINPMVHLINRDDSEQYVTIFTGTDIEIFDVAGNKKTVTYENNDKSYIQSTQPRVDLKAITIADYTFITNRTVKVAMGTHVTPNVWATQGALVNIKSGQYGRTYKITVDGVDVASFTTPDGSSSEHTLQIATDYIANQLATQITALTGYTVSTGPSWIYIEKNSGAISTIVVYDGYNNLAAFGMLTSIQKFADLPSSAPDGYTIKVAGEKGSVADDYYVAYNASEGVWKETIEPGILDEYAQETMPHIIVRNADGTFTFKEAEWTARDVGDDTSNPLPSFIDYTINDIFFFRNRLGVIAGENAILSKSANFFNFYMGSAMEVQSTDAIDVAVSDNKVATLEHATPFEDVLLLFSRNAQFSLTANGTFSPTNVQTNKLTNYAASSKVKPVSAGTNVYFAAERSEFTTLQEYFTVDSTTGTKAAQSVTTHIDNYINNGVYKIMSSTVDNILMLLSEGAPNKIFIYKYLFTGGIRQQASWSYWDMQGNIVGGDFIDNYLYLVMERNGRYFLEKMSLAYASKDFSAEPYKTYIDRKVIYTIPEGTYDSGTEITTINIKAPYSDEVDFTDDLTYTIVDSEGTYLTIPSGQPSVQLQGNWEGKTIVIGLSYNMKITMSQLMIRKTDTSGTTIATSEGRLQLKHFKVNYSNSGYFKVTVTHTDKQAYEYLFTGRKMGTSSNLINTIDFSSGYFNVPVQSLNTNCSIAISNDTPQPLAIIGAGWTANYYRRTKAV